MKNKTKSSRYGKYPKVDIRRSRSCFRVFVWVTPFVFVNYLFCRMNYYWKRRILDYVANSVFQLFVGVLALIVIWHFIVPLAKVLFFDSYGRIALVRAIRPLLLMYDIFDTIMCGKEDIVDVIDKSIS